MVERLRRGRCVWRRACRFRAKPEPGTGAKPGTVMLRFEGRFTGPRSWFDGAAMVPRVQMQAAPGGRCPFGRRKRAIGGRSLPALGGCVPVRRGDQRWFRLHRLRAMRVRRRPARRGRADRPGHRRTPPWRSVPARAAAAPARGRRDVHRVSVRPAPRSRAARVAKQPAMAVAPSRSKRLGGRRPAGGRKPSIGGLRTPPC